MHVRRGKARPRRSRDASELPVGAHLGILRRTPATQIGRIFFTQIMKIARLRPARLARHDVTGGQRLCGMCGKSGSAGVDHCEVACRRRMAFEPPARDSDSRSTHHHHENYSIH